jgi:hypothetical protein
MARTIADPIREFPHKSASSHSESAAAAIALIELIALRLAHALGPL